MMDPKKCAKKANKIFRRTGSTTKAAAFLKKCIGVRSLGGYKRRRKSRR